MMSLMTYKELQFMAPLLPKFIEIFKESAVEMAQLISSVVEQINSFIDCSHVLRRKLQEYKVCLKNMALCSREIGDFLSYADASIEVIGGPNNGTNTYVAQFHRYLERIYALYDAVEKSKNRLRISSYIL